MKKKKIISVKKIKELRKKKPLICKDCKLYNIKQGVCSVVVIDKGEKYELQTKPNDPCMWDKMGIEVNRIRTYSNGKDGFIEWTEPKNENI